jgi:hypothetical protein
MRRATVRMKRIRTPPHTERDRPERSGPWVCERRSTEIDVTYSLDRTTRRGKGAVLLKVDARLFYGGLPQRA